MATTLSQLRDTVYSIIREEQSDSSAYPVSLVDLFINSAQQRICTGMVMNPLNPNDVARKGQLPFLFVDKFYSNVPPTTLSVVTAVGDTVLDVADTTNFPSTGTLYIAGNIITYTGKTITTFTWCSNVLFAFDAGLQVSIVYSLPSDYYSPINVVYNNSFQLNAQLYDNIRENLNQYKGNNYNNFNNTSQGAYNYTYWMQPFYSIKDAQYLLVFNANGLDNIIHLRYEKMPTYMTISTDTTTINNDIYSKTTIPYLAVAEMFYNRWEEERAARIYNFAIGQVKEMYSFYNNSTYQRLSGVQYKTAKSVRNI